MTDPGQVEEVDVAAEVADVISQHAPGTSVSGQKSGGVQVIRVSLDLGAFRRLLVALSATLHEGSHLRLDVVGGLIFLDVTGGHLGAEHLDTLRELARVMDGSIVPDPPQAQGFSVQLPSGLSEWD